jgi:hypothetical protein
LTDPAAAKQPLANAKACLIEAAASLILACLHWLFSMERSGLALRLNAGLFFGFFRISGKRGFDLQAEER